MNRLVLIGNGFDLAHGLKTKYEDFMYWYWRGIVAYLVLQSKDVYEDTLCKVTNRKLDYWNLRELYHAENEELYSFLVNNDGAIDIYYSPMLERINKTGIGPAGMGGRITAMAVNIDTYPTHIAGLPVAVNICCHVNRHIVKTV